MAVQGRCADEIQALERAVGEAGVGGAVQSIKGVGEVEEYVVQFE